MLSWKSIFKTFRVHRLFSSSHSGVRFGQVLAHMIVLISLGYIPAIYLGIGLTYAVMVFNFGHSIGAHRYFSHSQFTAGALGKIILNFLFTLNMWGSSIGYAAVHVLHHMHSDDPSDPHCPSQIGALRLWLYTPEMRVHIPTFKRLSTCPINRFFHDYYFLIHVLVALFLCAFSWKLAVALWAVPIVVCYHLGKFQTVLAHIDTPLGGSPHDTKDHSKNLYILKPLLWGDELHNNHHFNANAVNLNFSSNVWEFDPNYWLIRTFFRTRLNYAITPTT